MATLVPLRMTFICMKCKKCFLSEDMTAFEESDEYYIM